MFGQGVAQALLQMPSVQHDAQYEDLQRLQQAAILRSACSQGKGNHYGRDTRTKENS